MDVSYHVQCAAASPVGVLFRLEIGLEYGVEHQNRRHHDRAVTNSGIHDPAVAWTERM
jgi:hypothetical protein